MRISTIAVATGAILASTVAVSAADLPIPAPVPVPVDFGGWYLRGDIGFSNQSVHHLSNALEANLITQSQHGSFDTAGIYGLGIGYQFNNWFRADVTGEYRGNSNFNGYEVNTFPVGGGASDSGFNKYTATKSEWLVLANAYVDLGTWWGVTPFVGAGVGTANISLSNYTDVGQTGLGGPSSAFAAGTSKWNFAWAVHAGLAYRVSPSLTMELAYRYVDMGSAATGDVIAFDGTNDVFNPTTFKHITSQDLKLGVRWAIDPMPAYVPGPPLITKG